MKKILLIIFLFLGTVGAVKFVGYYGDKFVILADNYVMKLPTNLAEAAQINNQFNVPLAPQILINDQLSTIAPLINESLIKNPQGSFFFESKADKQDVEVVESIELQGKLVISKIKFSNKGSEDVKIKIVYNFGFEESINFFSPYLFDNVSENYFIFLNPNVVGNALGVVSSVPLNQPTSNLQPVSSWATGMTIEILKTGQSITIEMRYYPFNAQYITEKIYPNEFSSFLEEPLIKVSGDIGSLNVNKSSSNFLNDLLNNLDESKKAKIGNFKAFHDVDVEGNSLDSLGTSIYFKEMCKKLEIPCKLVVGKVGNEMYAWVKIYLEKKWKNVDPFVRADVKPVGYDESYIEPKIELKILPKEETEEASVYYGTKWLKTIGEVSLLYYLIILIFIFVGVFIFVQIKAKKMIKYAETGEKMIVREDVNGKYNIIREDVKDFFSQEIIKKLKEKNGEVQIKSLAEELGYSEELIKSGIIFLSDNGFIKKIGEIITPTKKEEVTFKSYIPIMLKSLRKTFKTLTKKQKYIVIVILGVAIVLVILLFIL